MSDDIQQLLAKYRFRNISSLILFLALALGCFWILRPFLAPLLFGMIFTVELWPLFLHVRKKLKSPTWASLAIVFGCGLAVVIPLTYVGVRAATALTQIVSAGLTTNSTIVEVVRKVRGLLDDYGLEATAETYAMDALNLAGKFAANLAQAFLAGLPEIALFIIISLLTIFFGLRNFDRSIRFLRIYSFLPHHTFDLVVGTVQKSIHTNMVSNGATGALQAGIVSLMTLMLTDFDAFLIFILAFVGSFIPIIGAGPVCFLVGLSQFALGGTASGVTIIILSFFVGVVDNIARTYFAQVDPDIAETPVFATFLGIVGGVLVFGFPGLFFGPLTVDLFFRLGPALISEAIVQVDPEVDAETSPRN